MQKVGINCIALYGKSMRYGGCTAFHGTSCSYRKTALAVVLQGAVHYVYVTGALFRETYYSLGQYDKRMLLPQNTIHFIPTSRCDRNWTGTSWKSVEYYCYILLKFLHTFLCEILHKSVGMCGCIQVSDHTGVACGTTVLCQFRVQWNLPIPVTLGPDISGLNKEVVAIQ